MYKFIDISNPQDLALWCAFLVGFFGLLRKKSICPEDPSDVDPVKILTVRKVSVDRGKGNLSKTIQFGQRDLIIPLVSNNWKALDPVYHLDLLLSKTQASPDSPAFSYKTKSGSKSFITHKLFTSRLKTLLSKAGYSPEKFINAQIETALFPITLLCFSYMTSSLAKTFIEINSDFCSIDPTQAALYFLDSLHSH